MSNEKPVVFLLPGVLCDEEYWLPQKEALSAIADVRIPLFKRFSSLKDMAVSVLEGAPERFSVCGHSMGGRVAWELMKMAGNRIDRFAVMDTGAHRLQPGETEKRQVLLDLASEDMSKLMDHWTPPMVHPDRLNDEMLIKIIRDMGLRYTQEQFACQIRALLAREDQFLYLPEIEHEVLLICGDQDVWSPVKQHEEMLGLLKHGKLEVIENSGHMVSIEQPEQVNRILLHWHS